MVRIDVPALADKLLQIYATTPLEEHGVELTKRFGVFVLKTFPVEHAVFKIPPEGFDLGRAMELAQRLADAHA
jgi:hypothetical protein